jgi:uncharacterized protein YxjI
MAKSSRYKIHQKLLSIGDDFWIENEQGQKVFKIDGKALRIRKTLIMEDSHGAPLCQIQERMLRVKDTMEIEDPHGKRIALVQKNLINLLTEHWKVKIRDGADLSVKGDILDHEYTIREGFKKVAEVSKKWFKLTDTYGVDIDDDQEVMIILAVAIAIDMMVHDDD